MSWSATADTSNVKNMLCASVLVFMILIFSCSAISGTVGMPH
jgi:hypothetical protein